MSDRIGQRFSRLIVVAVDPSRKQARICRCDCGNTKSVLMVNLRNGGTKSCGCLQHSHKPGLKHVGRYTPTYRTWVAMRSRCRSESDPDWPAYGGRGIRVCERWEKFENFLSDMGPRPSCAYSIDRIENDGNYEPQNCRWATMSEQCRNRRSSRWLTFGGVTKTLCEWSAESGVSRHTIKYRAEHGLSDEQVLAPVRRSNQ